MGRQELELDAMSCPLNFSVSGTQLYLQAHATFLFRPSVRGLVRGSITNARLCFFSGVLGLQFIFDVSGMVFDR